MKTRILSAVVALPLLLFIVISGGIWLHVGVGLLGLIGMYEFNRAIAGEVKGSHISLLSVRLVLCGFHG